jgi:O-antigen/teichoic acid export membrane protein
LRKSFVQNIIFLVLINLIVKPFWVLGIDRTVQNTVGHDVYGWYQVLFNFTILFQIVLDFGLQSYNAKVVSQNHKAIRSLFPNILAAKCLLALVYLAISLSYGAFLGYTSQHFTLLLFLIVAQIAASFLLFFRSNIAALQNFKTDSLFSVTDRIIAIAILGALLFVWKKDAFSFKIETYALAQLIAYSLAAIAAFIVCVNLSKISWHHIRLKKTMHIIKGSFPYALLIFLMSIYTRADVILLKHISLDGNLAGKHAAAFRLLDVANNMSGVLIAGILLPLFGKMIANKEPFAPIADLATKLLLPFGITLAAICTFYSIDILQFLYKDIDTRDGAILGWLMWTFPLYSINYVYATLLTANGNIKTLIGISFVAVLVNLSINIVTLSPENAANAIYIARNSFVTLFIVMILNLWFCNKKLKIAISKITWLRYCVFTAIVIMGACFIKEYGRDLKLFYSVLSIGGIALASYVALGIINAKTISMAIKNIYMKP